MSNALTVLTAFGILGLYFLYLRWVYRLAIEADKPAWLWVIYAQLVFPGFAIFVVYLYGFVKAKRMYEIKIAE